MVISMGNRIKELRKSRGLSQLQLAEIVGTSNQHLGMLESGKRGLTTVWMERIAPALGVTPAELISDVASFQGIEVIGSVEAGVLKEAIEWADGDRYTINVPLGDIYKLVKPFALEVRGPSMNKVFQDGSVVICASMYNLGEEPIDGKRYVVQRKIDSHSYEATVKTLRIDDDGNGWLWPESTDPNFQTPEKINGNEGDEITILARVIGFYQQM